MGKTLVHPFRIGVTNCFFIGSGGAWALVDTSGPWARGRIMKKMGQLGIAPAALKLIILTHGHFDHIGSAAAVREATNAGILIHRLDRKMLEEGNSAFPKGFTRWGRFLETVSPVLGGMASRAVARADIILEGEQMSLGAYGIEGELLHTPGHTPGSLSVVLPAGTALVGDLVFNGSIMCRRPRFVLGEDLEQIVASWTTLLARGIKTVYPAHGRPFPAARIAEIIARS